MKTDDLLKARLQEVKEQVDARMAVVMPLREKRDKFIADTDKKVQQMNAEIKEAEEGLFDLRMEHGRLAKVTGGKTLSGM